MADAPTPGGKKGLLSKEEKEAVKARQIEVMKAECSAAELLMSGGT